MSIGVSFKYNADAMLGFLSLAAKSTESPNAPGLRRGFTEAADEHTLFLDRRYRRLSQGGGEWARLKPETVKAKGGDSRILRKNDSILRSLRRGGPGHVFVLDRRGAVYGTSIRHAKYHQIGGLHLPQRKIMVRPDQPTRFRMQGRIKESLRSAWGEAARQARAARPLP